MKINDKFRDQEFQYDINKQATKTSTLSSSKNDKYEYLTGEYYHQGWIINQVSLPIFL